MSKTNPNTVRRTLNHLAVACHDEAFALDSAALQFGGERGARLRQQSSRRGVFLGDLRSGVEALAGVPAHGPSYRAKITGALRSVEALVLGAHQGKGYISCARATARTARAYARALTLDLPDDVRFGLVRQQAEIDADWQELRWLRWGGSLNDAQSSAVAPGRAVSPAPAGPADRRALDVWEQDGGATCE